MDNLFVYLHPLPGAINEAVMPCEGGYTIYIDPRLSYDAQIRAYRHARKHIDNHDFTKGNVQDIEKDAHRG